uniref:Metallo-hydrolase/oxidoreductase superfamily protein n=1 Tax=Tanacetum cinerariifolium TaxID=118510 RepID=A0A6L2MGM6_TANCI|nr:metallo-hydrolase/oxidoreductase superfamily protein [Tanacetum cinerariifolium]
MKQTPPPKFNDHEYDSYADSDLWDLPSAKLTSLSPESDLSTRVLIQGQDTCSSKVDLTKFDFRSALNEVLGLVGFGLVNKELKFLKFVEEPNFGPGYPVETVYVTGEIVGDVGTLKGGDRVGPFVVEGLLKDSVQSDSLKLPLTLSCQEYPPGVNIVPMGSRTAKPFLTTNLIVFAPGSDNVKSESGPFVAQGDAMIVDPGCRSEFNKELAEIVAALPRKLIVYVTHHHRDHVDGLSTVQKTNPDACLLVHENTMNRISKDDWSGGCTTVSGTEEICIGGERLRIIFAPGHTDGHLALLHVSTNSLIVGDHCVGQGSAFLDINSGGNMSKSRMELYMLNRPHGRMILESVEQGPLIWPTVVVEGVTRLKKYSELSTAEAIQANCDVKATNIILQGLPPEVYALVSTHKVAKELWERIQMLMQGTSLTKQERECKLYDAFDKFAYHKGETLRDFYLRFSLLLNDMNMYNIKLEQFQVNTKFLNTLPSEWSKFVTDVKLVRDLHTTNIDQLHAYLVQHEYHANEGETLRDFYLRFSLLVNDMNMYNMKLEQFQVNTKFLNTLPSEWSKFVTDVKLVRDLHTTNVDQLHAYLGQHEYHANEVRLMNERTSDPLALISQHRLNRTPNRRNREDTILKAIEAGSNTLFDIVAYTYADVDRAYWIPAASNVRLHVDHLAHQNKLPAGFSLENFSGSCSQFTAQLQAGKL